MESNLHCKSPRRVFARINGSVAVFFGVFLAAALLLSTLWPGLGEEPSVSRWISSALVYALAMPLAALLFLRLPASTPVRSHRGSSAGHLLKWFCIAIAMMYAGNLISLNLANLIGLVTGTEVANPVQEAVSTNGGWIATSAMAVLVAPLAEELFFRKLMIDRLRPYGEGIAVAVSALLFGCFHGNIHQFFYAFLVGLLFGYVYLRSGSLRDTWLLHALVNFFGGVVGPLVSRLMLSIELPDPEEAEAFMAAFGQVLPAFVISMLYVLLCLGLAVAGTVFFVKEIKNLKAEPLKPATEELSRKKVVSCALLNVGTLGALLATAYMMWNNLT